MGVAKAKVSPQMEKVMKLAHQAQIILACQSFEKFRARYLHQTYPDGEFHTQMMKDLQTTNRLVQAAPRYFAKTVIGARDWTLYVLLTEKRKDVIMLSATGALAQEILRQIKRELEFNPLLREDFGSQTTDKWTESHIILPNGGQARAHGIGYQIRGFHPDCFILDDLENDENIRSAEQREKLRDWFFKAVMGTLDEQAQLIVQGTVLHPLSLLAELLSDPTRESWKRRKYKAIEGGKSIWSSRWSLEALEKKRLEIGSVAFQSEYLNDPMSIKDAIIKQEWVQYEEGYPMEVISTLEGNKSQPIPLFYYTAVDPAISKSDAADETAIVTVGVVSKGPRKGEVFVVNVTHGKWSVYETIDQIINIYQRFSPRMIGIEITAYQRALKDTVLVEARRKGIYLPVTELKADKDKVRRLSDVSPMIENGLVKFKRNQFDLIEQLVTMSPSMKDTHDDLVDALVYALQLVQEKPFVQSVKDARNTALPTYAPARVSEGLVYTGY